MAAAFEHLVWVWSHRVGSSACPSPEILFKRIYRSRAEAVFAAENAPNWNSQKIVELVLRTFHPEQEDGDQGMPTAQWRLGEKRVWESVTPTVLPDLADAALRERLATTWKR